MIIASSVASECVVQLFRYRTLALLRALGSPRTSTTARSSRQSVPDPGDGWDPCARCDPPVVGLELQAELLIEDLKVAVPTAHDRLRHDRLHFLRHDADIGSVAAVIAEAIEPKAVVEMAEQGDVVLQRNIGTPAAATTAASSSATPRGHARRSSATADALAAAISLGVNPGA